jgi:uncharacterized membrane protein
MNSISRYSYVLFSIVVVTALVWWAIWSGNAAFGVSALLAVSFLLIFWVAARREAPMPANPDKRIRRARESTRPVVVHFFSDYSLGCLVTRVLVAGVEKRYRGRFDMIFIDMNHRDGDGVAQSLKAGLGDFVLFDPAGNFVARTKLIGKRRLEAVLERPAQ